MLPIKQPPGVAAHHCSCHPVVIAALQSGLLLLLRYHGGVARRLYSMEQRFFLWRLR